jgi:putative ABC transport system permease protein
VSVGRIAVRNVTRHRRRTLLSGAALVFGVAFAVFLGGFLNAVLDRVVLGTVEGTTGALQVHRRGFLDAEQSPLLLDMPASDALIAAMRAVENVRAVAPRINFEGLLGNGNAQRVILGLGIDPASEAIVCPRRTEIEIDGLLAANEPAAINVGVELMRSLKLEGGSTVSLLATTQRGAQNALDAKIKGRIDSPVPFTAKRVVTAPLALVQPLLRMQGRVTEYAIGVHDLSRLAETRAAVQAAVGPEYAVITWAERDTNAANFAFRLRALTAIVETIMLALVLTLIASAILSAIYERVREIGTLLAFGMRRRQILRMFLVEAGTLGFVCAIAGAIVGGAVTLVFGHAGIVLQPPDAPAITLYPSITVLTLALPIAMSTLGAVVAALVPAYKASRLTPTEALRG